MKKLKEIVICVLTLALMSGFVTPAFAADGSAADPYIGGNDLLSPDAMSITIHKYDISSFERAKAAELIAAGSLAAGETVSYTPGDNPTGVQLSSSDIVGTYKTSVQNSQDIDVTLAEITSLGDVIFRIEEVKPKAGKTPGSNNVDDYEATGSVNEYAKTDNNGIVAWTGLPKGHYRITEPANDTGSPLGPNSYIISVPMIDPADNTKLLDEVHLYPKNTTSPAPIIVKEKPSANDFNGNVVTWTIKSQIPETLQKDKGLQEYVISDTLGTGLTYKGNLKVYYLSPADSSGGSATEVVLESGKDYTVDAALDGSSLKVSLDADGFTKLGEALAANKIDKDANNRFLLYVVYDSIVNISESDFQNNVMPTNEVSLDFTNSDGHSYNDGPPPTTLDKYAGLHVFKKDGANNSILLSGAEFKIYTALESDNQTVAAASVLRDAAGNEIVFTTDSQGEFFYGGLGEGKYYIQETKPPVNYKALAGPTTVEITSNDTDNQEVVEATLFNYRDNTFSFPQTGGMGTLVFTVLGLALSVTAGILFASAKKSSHKDTTKSK